MSRSRGSPAGAEARPPPMMNRPSSSSHTLERAGAVEYVRTNTLIPPAAGSVGPRTSGHGPNRSATNAWSVPTIAAVTGVAVGTLGGLIGLGGAEFRLPILVAVFGYGVRQAVGLNLGISLVTVLAGVTSRLLLGHAGVSLSIVSAVGVPMAVGGMLGAYSGSSWLARVRDSTLHRTIRWLLLGIGALLLVEALTPWVSPGLPLTASPGPSSPSSAGPASA